MTPTPATTSSAAAAGNPAVVSADTPSATASSAAASADRSTVMSPSSLAAAASNDERPRPVCRYFNTPTGCLKQDCRFLHASSVDTAPQFTAEQTSNPLLSSTEGASASTQDQAKSPVPCRWHLVGYCHRGQQCWFSHDQHIVASRRSSQQTSARRTSLSSAARTFIPGSQSTAAATTDAIAYDYGEHNAMASSSGSSGGSGSTPHHFDLAILPVTLTVSYQEEPDTCGICMDVPVLYGLLENCDHVFCMVCLRKWRSAQRRNDELRDSGVTKQCPACRTQSHFVTPSSHPQRGECKKLTIELYKERLAKLLCRHFEKSKVGLQGPFCPFGDDCHYAHQLTSQDDRYLFNCGAAEMLRRPRGRRNRPRFGDDERAERLTAYTLDELMEGGLDTIRGGIQSVLGMLQSFQEDDEEDFDLDSGWDDFYDGDDVWGLGGGSLGQFGFGQVWDSGNVAMQDIDPHAGSGPIRARLDAQDVEDDDDDDENYFDQQDDPEEADGIDDDDDDDDELEYSNDVFGLRRAFEEGYARADLDEDDDGEVHGFDRNARAAWEDHGRSNTSDDESDDVADRSLRSGVATVEGRGCQTAPPRTWRSRAPSPSSSFEERIWAIQDHQARFLGNAEYAAAMERWEEYDQDSQPPSRSEIDSGGDVERRGSSGHTEREEFMADLLEAARQSLGLDSDGEMPAEYELAFRASEAEEAAAGPLAQYVDPEAEVEGEVGWYDPDRLAFAAPDDDDVIDGETVQVAEAWPHDGEAAEVQYDDVNVPAFSGYVDAVEADEYHYDDNDGEYADYDDGGGYDYDDGADYDVDGGNDSYGDGSYDDY